MDSDPCLLADGLNATRKAKASALLLMTTEDASTHTHTPCLLVTSDGCVVLSTKFFAVVEEAK